ncbi:unnamed protein product [Effrenium voratum]|uniref:Uncharacterized protein n=1 Tax=Effrenium voratum TaxID=2562239 RepID=A0AA36HXW0_9DINO|nr:unnamed protein product [Effrenium voratum]
MEPQNSQRRCHAGCAGLASMLPKCCLCRHMHGLECISACPGVPANRRIMMWRHQCQSLLSSKIMLQASSVGRLPRLACQEACSLVAFVGPVCSCLDVSCSCQSSSLSWRSFSFRTEHEVLVLKSTSWDLGVGYPGLRGKHALHIRGF